MVSCWLYNMELVILFWDNTAVSEMRVERVLQLDSEHCSKLGDLLFASDWDQLHSSTLLKEEKPLFANDSRPGTSVLINMLVWWDKSHHAYVGHCNLDSHFAICQMCLHSQLAILRDSRRRNHRTGFSKLFNVNHLFQNKPSQKKLWIY